VTRARLVLMCFPAGNINWGPSSADGCVSSYSVCGPSIRARAPTRAHTRALMRARTRTRARTHAHTRAHACAHARAHARTHARTHARANTPTHARALMRTRTHARADALLRVDPRAQARTRRGGAVSVASYRRAHTNAPCRRSREAFGLPQAAVSPHAWPWPTSDLTAAVWSTAFTPSHGLSQHLVLAAVRASAAPRRRPFSSAESLRTSVRSREPTAKSARTNASQNPYPYYARTYRISCK
jgi:hypothetical protein